MASVDRTKHDFDVLEHVLRGVHASTDEFERLLVREGVPTPFSERDLPELRVRMPRGRGDAE
jgi:hypothetical protein